MDVLVLNTPSVLKK